MNIELRPLRDFEEDDFIRENQIAFDKAAVVEFGPQKESVIPREDIVSSIHAKNAEAFRIIADGNAVGGVVVAIHPETQINSLYLLFVSPDHHSRGIGQQVWRMIEEKYPGICIHVYCIRNEFFGERITVSGLITGQDIISQLKGQRLGSRLLIPCSMMKADEDVFLDDYTVKELSEALQVRVDIVKSSGQDLIDSILND